MWWLCCCARIGGSGSLNRSEGRCGAERRRAVCASPSRAGGVSRHLDVYGGRGRGLVSIGLSTISSLRFHWPLFAFGRAFCASGTDGGCFPFPSTRCGSCPILPGTRGRTILEVIEAAHHRHLAQDPPPRSSQLALRQYANQHAALQTIPSAPRTRDDSISAACSPLPAD